MTVRPVGLGVVVSVAVLIGLVVGRLAAPSLASPSPSSPKLREYCTTVHVALGMDADDLDSGSEKRRIAAVLRFGELVTYHSEQEIALCAKAPVDLRTRGTCALNRDYACLAKLARVASEGVKP